MSTGRCRDRALKDDDPALNLADVLDVRALTDDDLDLSLTDVRAVKQERADLRERGLRGVLCMLR